MRLLITLVALIFSFSVSTVEAACVIHGEYYSDAECQEIRPTRIPTSQSPAYEPPGESLTLAQLESYIEQLIELLEQVRALKLQITRPVPEYRSTAAVSVETRSAIRVDDAHATLRARLDLNREDEATVYFRYGQNRLDLQYETIRIVLDDRDDEDFTQRVRNLRENITYYYRAVAEDEDGRRAYGEVERFRTDRNGYSFSDEPDVDTDEAENIEETQAELIGSVDMNDFRNGRVFFVYGEEEDQVEDVEDDYDEYSDIDEDGDDLQKVNVDSDLDGEQEYELTVRGLDDDTQYYFSICVEYEDEDDDETISCGRVEQFTTDD